MREMPAAWAIADHTLLVIEDASESAALIRVAARRAHPTLDVRVAGDGREGIAYLAGTPPFHHRWSHPLPDLVILDLLMPDVDGLEVLEWTRANRAVAAMPVVVLTASLDPEHEARSLALGASAFFRKPADAQTLGALVSEIVSRWLIEPGEAPTWQVSS